MSNRIDTELRLLRQVFPDIVYAESGDWFLIPSYPSECVATWTPTPFPTVFHAQPGHPGQAPYGIWVSSGARASSRAPDNIQDPSNKQPPFPGRWAVLSWTVEADQWRPSANVVEGSNLLNYALGFRERFMQGR